MDWTRSDSGQLDISPICIISEGSFGAKGCHTPLARRSRALKTKHQPEDFLTAISEEQKPYQYLPQQGVFAYAYGILGAAAIMSAGSGKSLSFHLRDCRSPRDKDYLPNDGGLMARGCCIFTLMVSDLPVPDDDG